MIGRLRGIVVEKRPPHLLLEVAGLAYELEAPMTAFYGLPEIGAEATLYTHLLVRDDALQLYGFARPDQRRLFRGLLRVAGVGGRTALAILSGLDTKEFIACVQREDSARLTTVPGIGRKTAERLIVEMRDRIKDFPVFEPGAAVTAMAGPAEDAVLGLMALGYSRAEAQRSVNAVARSGDARQGLDCEALIRFALQRLAGV